MELSVNFNFARDFFPGVFDENYLVFFDLLFQVNEGFVFYEKTDSGLVIDALKLDLSTHRFELVLIILIIFIADLDECNYSNECGFLLLYFLSYHIDLVKVDWRR